MSKLEKRTMNNFVSFLSKSYGDLDAASYVDDTAFSFNDIAKIAYKFSSLLDQQGIKPGEKVVLLSENSPWWPLIYLSVTACGRVIVPVLVDFPEEDIHNIIKHSDAKAIFVSSRLYKKVVKYNKAFAPKYFLAEGFEKIPHKTEDLSQLKKSPDEIKQSVETFDISMVKDFFESITIDENELCSLIYTSGTTGMSKGVMLSHKNILFDAVLSTIVPPPKKINNTLSILPLAHTYECTLGMVAILYKGAHIHYLKRGLSISSLLSALRKVRPEMMFSVPLLIEKIYRKSVVPSFNKSKFVAKIYATTPGRLLLHRVAGRKMRKMFGGRLFFFGVGGAGIAPDVEKFLLEAKFPYCMGYGLTETAPLVVGFNFERARYRSTGFLLEGIDVKIDNPDPETGEGEILVKGENVMLGYYKDKKKTAEVMTEDGYFRTGDLGLIEKNYLYIKGRLKNMILGPGGENIYPEAIEALINRFDFVEDSLVFHDDEKGIVAKIHFNYDDLKDAMGKLKDQAVSVGHSMEDYLKDLQKGINKKLGSFTRVTHVVEQKDPFEKTPTNKIKRYLHDGMDKDGKDLETDSEQQSDSDTSNVEDDNK